MIRRNSSPEGLIFTVGEYAVVHGTPDEVVTVTRLANVVTDHLNSVNRGHEARNTRALRLIGGHDYTRVHAEFAPSARINRFLRTNRLVKVLLTLTGTTVEVAATIERGGSPWCSTFTKTWSPGSPPTFPELTAVDAARLADYVRTAVEARDAAALVIGL